jgi:CDP-paratose synthetase
MNILLTGASGFLGSALALRLLDAGHDLALLLRPHSSVQRLRGQDRRCRVARASTDAEIADFVSVAAPDVVIHTACSYGRRGETALELFDANLRLGMVLMQALLRAATPRRVSSSTPARAWLPMSAPMR